MSQICYTKFLDYTTDGHLTETVVDLQNGLEVRDQGVHVHLPIILSTNSCSDAYSLALLLIHHQFRHPHL